MFRQIPTLQKLIRCLQRVPYLASKNVYRVATHFLADEKQNIEQLCATILEAKNKIKMCSQCCNWTETDVLCTICSARDRIDSVICIVETWHDLWAIEKLGEFRGRYHVLGGSLCPMEGIGPEHLTINLLIKRLDVSVKEIIFATNPTPEGEATASYIVSKIDQNLDIVISKLASGVPIGSSLEYMDRVTISKALSGRRPF
ncbi:MAG: recombination mediator RecR [bacterium]